MIGCGLPRPAPSARPPARGGFGAAPSAEGAAQGGTGEGGMSSVPECAG